MTKKVEQLKNKVEAAVNNSIPEIQQLLHLNIHEQTIRGVIIKHLTPSFRGLEVDPDYNKHFGAAKQILLKKYVEEYRNKTNEERFDCTCTYCRKIKSNEEFRDTKRSKRPDIVIHERNSDNNNEVVIEIKKSKICLWDCLKLRYMTGLDTSLGVKYKYKLGIFIYFSYNKPKYKWFVDGLEKS